MDVLCIGHTAWDITVFVPEYPAENTKCEIHSMIECGGGPAANAAYLLSKWGAQCALAAEVGNDAYGDRLVHEHDVTGTDLSLLKRSDTTATPVSVILVNEKNGSRTIINRKTKQVGPTAALRLLSRPQWQNTPSVLLFDGHELEASLDAMRLFPQARTILDAGSLRSGTRELAKRVDYLVSSEKFARELTGVENLTTEENQKKAISALYRYNGHPVVITCGERGVFHGTEQSMKHLPALKVDARDTTGAGDIFHGSFAYGILRQMLWEETLRLAMVTASLSVCERGGRTSIPSLEKVQETLGHVG